MKRRDLLAFAGTFCAAALSMAQPPTKTALVAILVAGSPETSGYLIDAFKRGMRELGYVEGKNVVFEIRWASGRIERLPELARELVALKPDVIWTGAEQSLVASQRATSSIPIVGGSMTEAVRSGFAQSLARPGGNITGYSGIGADLTPKLLEFLLMVVPAHSNVAFLWNPTSPSVNALENLQAAAPRLDVKLLVLQATNATEIEAAFTQMERERVSGAIISGDALFFAQRQQIATLALNRRIPLVLTFREYVDAGGLMSYGVNLAESYRRSAKYVDKILKGAKPGDLPIEQATILELVINLKTAKAISVDIPQSLLLRADEVIR